MALPGELKGLGGCTCMDCGSHMKLDVQLSGAGYYLGYWCRQCGPYSRETGYFATKEDAQDALNRVESVEPSNIRNYDYNG